VRYTEAFEPEVAVERVLIRVEAGEVEIEAAEVLRVERAIRAPRGSLELSHRVEGGQLILEAHCRGLLPCAVDTLVSLPPGIPVEVELGHGGVARATVQVGEGSVTARLTPGARADLTVAEGDIDVTVQGGSWQIEATAADVRLSGIESSEDGDGQLHLVAPSGEVRVRLPEPVARR
jgi:HSP20 family molecular chaperone IbpA